jgi:tetratricopeptide (TPR) repeat protein
MGLQVGASSEHFGLIGEHYLRGEAWLLAADHLEKAGDTAAKLFANAEACEHYRRAMECLARLPETDETRKRRLRLLLRLNDVAFMAEPPARGLTRLLQAERLAKEIQGEDMRLTLSRVHRESLESFGGRLFIHHWSLAADAVRLLLAGRREDAVRVAEEAVALTQTIEDSYGQGIAHRVLGQARAAEGPSQWDAAEAHFNESERLLTESEAVIELARTWEARALARRARGDEERARAYFKRALDTFEEGGLPDDAARVRALLEAVSSPEEPHPAR